jgi:ATP-dependent helicase HrpB
MIRHAVPDRLLTPLPVDDYLDEVREGLARDRAVVVSAAPGAGKTTRIPPALVDRGPVILLQPRRVAARAVTRRIADEQGWKVGREVGWQIRFERRSSSETRLLVVTEGILTARLQNDPLLSDFATIVFDEFHERSIHSDLGLALARQAWFARDELNLVVMSATLDVERVADFLGGCAVVNIPGLLHPNAIEYAADEDIVGGISAVLPRSMGQILCFLPGAPEIQRAERDLRAAGVQERAAIIPLHGSIDSDTQDRAMRPINGRRVILATNIAETSLTVPGVSTVVDTGLQKVARYDSARGIDSLTLERVSQDSADQRAGRAARLGPGLVRRLWDARQRLRPHREPEIARLDLAGPVLYLLAWGAHPARFEWFDPPPAARVADALRLLERLGASDAEHRITTIGKQMLRLPMHPRLARILMDGSGAPEAVAVCARLSGDITMADQLQRVVAYVMGTAPRQHISDAELRHALFVGYADRLARRRDRRDRVTLASGHGAVIGPECEPFEEDYLVALDVVASDRAGVAEARIRAASPVDAGWVVPTATTVEHKFDADTGRVRAAKVQRYDALILSAHPVAPDPLVAAELLAHAWLSRGPDERAARLLLRARFAGLEIDLPTLAREAAFGAESLADLDVSQRAPYGVMRQLDAEAPDLLTLPTGRHTRLEYGNDGTVSAAVKLQELFGLADSPRLGTNHVPVTFELLAPNGHPVQTTRDLRSFWTKTYPEVRNQLRGRYPKHPWPEDPWTATPSHRTVRRTRDRGS